MQRQGHVLGLFALGRSYPCMHVQFLFQLKICPDTALRSRLDVKHWINKQEEELVTSFQSFDGVGRFPDESYLLLKAEQRSNEKKRKKNLADVSKRRETESYHEAVYGDGKTTHCLWLKRRRGRFRVFRVKCWGCIVVVEGIPRFFQWISILCAGVSEFVIVRVGSEVFSISVLTSQGANLE